jgi:hypothetical protein
MCNKYFLVFFVFFIPFYSFGQQENNTRSIKKGIFTFGEGIELTKIKRTKRKQIEMYNNGASKLFFRIKWHSDSTYTIVLKKKVNAQGCLQIGDEINCTVLSKSNNSYSARCSCSNTKCGETQIVDFKIK